MNNQNVLLIQLSNAAAATGAGPHAANEPALFEAISRLGKAFQYNGLWYVFNTSVTPQEVLGKIQSVLGGMTPVIGYLDTSTAVLPDKVTSFGGIASQAA